MPTQRNSNALNIAWVRRWKNARLGIPSPSEKIITPSCLSVEKATIFLKSNSADAEMPARSMVILPVMRSIVGAAWERLRTG